MPAPTDRITTVTVGKYDQVIAMTQFLINQAFSNLWLENSGKGDPEDQVFTLEDRGGSLVDCSLNAPKVMVNCIPGVYAQVVFFMNFAQGSCQVFKAAKGNDKTDYDMGGWVFGFPVNLKFSQVTDPAKKQEIERKINKPGNYTIQQLLLDMTTADVTNYNTTWSSFGDVDWSKQTKYVQDGFNNLINNNLEELFTAEEISLGYIAEAVDPVDIDHPPTFLPTGVTFQTSPWKDPTTGVQVEPGLKGNSRLNYLLYCEMTDERPLPVNPYEILTYSGNWTDGTFDQGNKPTSTDFGTFAMSRENFLGRYLFPKLRKLNAGLEPFVKDLSGSIRVDGLYLYAKWFTNVSIGFNPNHPNQDNDSYYEFKPTSDPHTYYFSSSYVCPQMYDEAGWKGALGKTWGNANCSCNNTLTFVPGSSQIIIKGSSLIHFYWSIWNGTTKDDSLTWNVDWTITLDLESVRDGGLQINVTAPKPVLTHGKDWKVHNLGNFRDYVEKYYANTMMQFSILEQQLIDDLAGQQKFYFPASGQLFFNNPTLNHEGDLLCEIAYNGNNSNDPNPEAPLRKEVTIVNYSPPPQPTEVSAIEDQKASVGKVQTKKQHRLS